MAKIISIHSFRGGTGKSNIAANLAYILAKDGKRVGVIDADVQSPGIHNLFGLEGKEITASLNDYLKHGKAILETALDVTSRLEDTAIAGKLYLIPSSIDPTEIANILKNGYVAEQFTSGLKSLIDGFGLDVLIIDTHPGLNEETLLSLLISHALVIMMRPDKQDYEGTGITIKVARELDVPRMTIVVNKAHVSLPPQVIKAKVEEVFGCEVAGVIPHSDEMMSLASGGIFAHRYPNHPISYTFRQIAELILT